MKTTVEIEGALLRDAKRLARERRTTLRALIESGLRHVLRDEPRAPEPFTLRECSFGGDIARTELGGARDEIVRTDGTWDWDAIRRATGGGRSG